MRLVTICKLVILAIIAIIIIMIIIIISHYDYIILFLYYIIIDDTIHDALENLHAISKVMILKVVVLLIVLESFLMEVISKARKEKQSIDVLCKRSFCIVLFWV
jgi:hypothetical protein